MFRAIRSSGCCILFITTIVMATMRSTTTTAYSTRKLVVKNNDYDCRRSCTSHHPLRHQQHLRHYQSQQLQQQHQILRLPFIGHSVPAIVTMHMMNDNDIHETTTTNTPTQTTTSASNEITAVDLAQQHKQYTTVDEEYLQLAVRHAKIGYGYTYPNPAVGCVVVLSTSSSQPGNEWQHKIIGQGYHPRSGYPHAEVFALLQVAGHVSCGIQAANAVLQHYKNVDMNRKSIVSNRTSKTNKNEDLYEHVSALTKVYQGPNGTQRLFESCFQKYYTHLDQDCEPLSNDNTNEIAPSNTYITMYVTLEPCCHDGKRTPPCTGSILMSYRKDRNSNATAPLLRIVVGSRDPNPRVDGGGIRILQQKEQEGNSNTKCDDHDHGHDHSTNIAIVAVPTELYNQVNSGPSNCNAIISNFAKRITFLPTIDYNNTDSMNGRIRRGLRTIAGQMIQNKTLPSVSWGSYMNTTTNIIVPYKFTTIDLDRMLEVNSATNALPVDKNELLLEAVNTLEIYPPWMEYIDGLLWEHELVLVRLNNANIKKRKGALFLGRRLASPQYLNAHIVQSKGHTILLYRPSSTKPIIDVNQFSNDSADDEEDYDDDVDD